MERWRDGVGIKWWNRFDKSPELAGVDVGSGAVKVVQLRRRGKALEVVHLGLEALPPEVIVDAGVADATILAAVVARLLESSGIATRAVVAGLSGNSVIVRKLTLPAAVEPMLGDAVRREAAQLLPFALEEVHLDYDVLFDPGSGATGAKGAKNGVGRTDAAGQTMDVLLCAARKEKVLALGHLLGLAGCTADLVDLDVLALQNCYEYNYQPDEGSVVALLNLGASLLNISILRGVRPLFTRDIAVGGNLYTDAIQKELDLSPEEAEAAKAGEFNFRSEAPDQEMNPETNAKVNAVVNAETNAQTHAETKAASVVGADPAAIAQVLSQVNQIIALEVRKTLDFFQGASAHDPVERIYLAGGSSRIPGLAAALEAEFSVAVEGLYPFRRIGLPKHGPLAALATQHGEQMAVAVGLALRSFD